MPPSPGCGPSATSCTAASEALKFPPSMVLEALLRHAWRTGSPQARAMVDATCEAMARGGMYDQLGGGFARYAVDRAWVVPHFEKMLYDNALLLGVYARWGTRWGSGSPQTRRTSWSASWVRRRAGWRPRSTPTPRVRKGGSTSGHRPSSPTRSARTTVRGPRTRSR